MRGRTATRFVVCSVVPARNSVVRQAAAGKSKNSVARTADEAWSEDRLSETEIDRRGSFGQCRRRRRDYTVIRRSSSISEPPLPSTSFPSAGAYIGGVIAPGLEAMTNFLYQRTALLPRLNFARAEKRGRENDAGSDDGGRGFRISWTRVRNYRADQSRTNFADKRSHRGDRWLCAVHCRAQMPEIDFSSSKSNTGRIAASSPT